MTIPAQTPVENEDSPTNATVPSCRSWPGVHLSDTNTRSPTKGSVGVDETTGLSAVACNGIGVALFCDTLVGRALFNEATEATAFGEPVEAEFGVRSAKNTSLLRSNLAAPARTL